MEETWIGLLLPWLTAGSLLIGLFRQIVLRPYLAGIQRERELEKERQDLLFSHMKGDVEMLREEIKDLRLVLEEVRRELSCISGRISAAEGRLSISQPDCKAAGI